MSNPLLKRSYSDRYYNATFGIIVINILVFLLNTLDPQSRIYLAMVPQLIVGAGAYWEFITYMFVHANVMHILFNMLGLFFFGFQVERRMGSTEFVVFYMLSGIGAGIISFFIYVLTGTYGVILLGASGAVFAVLLAYATFFPDSMIYVFGILPIRAPLLVLIYAAIELFSSVFGMASGVAHLTHLAGFLVAYLYLLIRIGVNPVRVFFGRTRW
ncbi:MAG TPA: rhomboid family intramembrane serine protease [Spirochaetia bacterium]|nr:rhomboid family intramembrane serine protease [Spirochaetia bacterium]